jgi:hypothetical protein
VLSGPAANGRVIAGPRIRVDVAYRQPWLVPDGAAGA